jgi:hypothetical protein
MATQNTLSTANVSIETGSTKLGTASIKAKNSSHIVQVLVNTMYANKEASSVREILSNAIDAHNMSNVKEKVEIQIPTKTFPMLRIRDFGTGLSPEYMMNEYLSLGHSEKRDRNDAVGFMGLGRFALFSLFKSYFVTSYYKGKKYPYSIHLDTGGDIAIDLIEDEIEDTDEPNGLEVFVLVESEQRMLHFHREILKLTFFCKDKVDLVNIDEDELPSWYTLKPEYTFDNISVYDKSNSRAIGSVFNAHPYDSTLVGVYDNIPYDFSSNFNTENVLKLQKTFNSNCLVAITLPIGSVERTASREGLERDQNNKTWNSLDKITKEALIDVETFKKSFVAKIKDFHELAVLSKMFFQYFNSKEVLNWTSPNGIKHSINYQGFVSQIFRSDIQRYSVDSRNGRMSKKDAGVNGWRSLKIDFDSSIFIENDVDERDTVWKSRIKNFIVTDGKIKNIYMFDTESEDSSTFLKEIDATKLSTLPKPDKEANAKDKEILCFHSLQENYNSLHNYTLDSINVKPDYFKNCIVVYFTCKQRSLVDTPSLFEDRNGVRELLRFSRLHGGNAKSNESTPKDIPKFFFCGLSERNVSTVKKNKNFYTWDKFVEKLPKLIPLTEEHFNSGIHQFFSVNTIHTENWTRLVSHKKMEDTLLKSKIEELLVFQNEPRVNDNSPNKINRKILNLYKDSSSEKVNKIEELFLDISDIMKKYPLVSNIYNFSESLDEIVIYINAKKKILDKKVSTKKKKVKKKVS